MRTIHEPADSVSHAIAYDPPVELPQEQLPAAHLQPPVSICIPREPHDRISEGPRAVQQEPIRPSFHDGGDTAHVTGKHGQSRRGGLAEDGAHALGPGRQ